MPYTPQQLSQLRNELIQRRERLLEDVRDELAKTDHADYLDLLRLPGDNADRSLADTLADLDLGTIDRHVHEIRDIEAALERLRDGSYGVCERCATEIGFERLLAYPTATRCLPCQEQYEKTHAHVETPRL
jgi:DnaK suppressor protein